MCLIYLLEWDYPVSKNRCWVDSKRSLLIRDGNKNVLFLTRRNVTECSKNFLGILSTKYISS